MIVWGIEDEPVPETDLTTSTPTHLTPQVYWHGRDGLYRWNGQAIEKIDAPLGATPSGWFTAWRIVGWMLLAGALGAAIGGWLVVQGVM